MSAHACSHDQPNDGQNTGDAVQAAIRTRVGFYDAMPVGLSQFAQRDTRLALLEKELEGINTTLTDLRRRRNFLIYASGSPPEVLSSIFHFLADIEPNYYPNFEDYPDVVTGKLPSRLGWLKVTQVCYSWRAAACGDARLWTSVTTSLGMQWATEMLRLSKSLPISLDSRSFGKSDKLNISPLPIIVEEANRLSQLQIMCDASGAKGFRDICAVPFPMLESLKVFVGGAPYAISLETISSHIPLLRELYLHNIDVPWSFFLGKPGLTRLTLSFNVSTIIASHSVRQILEVIADLPELEYLCMKNCRFNFIEADIGSAASAPIPCPRLTDVVLSLHSALAAVLVLCSLSIHPDARVDLAGVLRTTFGSTATERAVFDLFHGRMIKKPVLASMQTIEWRSHGVERVPFDENRADPLYERTLVLSAWHENYSDYLLADYEGYPVPPAPHFRLTLGFSRMIQRSSFVEPDDILPWQELFPSARSLSLQTSYRFPLAVGSWREIFEGCPQLEWLRVDRQVAESFLRLNSKVPMAIKILALLGVNWRGDYVEDDDEDEDDGEPSADRQMVDIWQETRKEGGALAEIIVGATPYHGAGFARCVYESDIELSVVERPEWLVDGHEDWDDRAEW